jgi:hypothetical protein
MKILNVLNGYKTYLAATGLVGLAIYQASTSQYEQAVQSFLAALAAAGLRHAVAKQAARMELLS